MIIPKIWTIDTENSNFYLLAMIEQTVRGVELTMKLRVSFGDIKL